MKSHIAKTVLEYLVMINEQSYSGIGRELNITPQQFSDWIKKRRPIPKERLQALANYFGVKETVLVDEQYYVNPLSSIAKIELHLLLVDQKVAELEAQGREDEDIEPYLTKKKELEREKKNQIRLNRMAAILEQDDERVGDIVDLIMDELDSGRINELTNKLMK
ncbi:helix-turn-helix domain-containing protein [Paenibacillus provencensis]|uniref:Helix-turn-helix domain-containing protein n=1 Tax=Paenibacillus provencensis TaxID=441151 RepID=A0ABW3PP93_9BACL|nr:helix-turn-helix transcriptional regulator [Paenibacillus sp. MER 78]MCM3129579.1 helix-turn-helix domain-containing protein [Paenibacillus sp. MER 78]